jgi:hypothetical protein
MNWKETISKNQRGGGGYQHRRPIVERINRQQAKAKKQQEIKAQIEKLTAQITQLKQQEQALEQGTEMPIQQNKPQNFE